MAFRKVMSSTGNVNLSGGMSRGKGKKIHSGLVPAGQGIRSKGGRPFTPGAHFVKRSPQPRG